MFGNEICIICKSKTNKDTSTEIFPPLLPSLARTMPRAKKVSKKFKLFK